MNNQDKKGRKEQNGRTDKKGDKAQQTVRMRKGH